MFTMSGRRIALAMRVVLVSVSVLWVALAQSQELPPTESAPRSAEAWAALHAGAARGFHEQYPEHVSALQSLQQRIRDAAARYSSTEQPLSEALAQQLVGELYVDAGHPALNARAQGQFVEMIGRSLRGDDTRCTPAARAVLQTGLMRYAAQGGGRATPVEQATLAAALALCGEKGAPLADELLTDAHAWASDVQSESQLSIVTRHCVERWGDAFILDTLPLPSAGAGAELPKGFRDALERIRKLLESPAPEDRELASRVREALRSVSNSRLADVLKHDLAMRLLIALRAISERQPAVGERVAEVIAESLVMLARNDSIGRDEDWKRWEQAVLALGERRSPESLKRAVARIADEPNIAEGGRRAAERLVQAWALGAELGPRR
ncbi:MAG: hypothetical protein IPM64_08870 [Phycisphaerales bacterium]|nr:hypothetical protein [Phycisphaerales bacterium]